MNQKVKQKNIQAGSFKMTELASVSLNIEWIKLWNNSWGNVFSLFFKSNLEVYHWHSCMNLWDHTYKWIVLSQILHTRERWIPVSYPVRNKSSWTNLQFGMESDRCSNSHHHTASVIITAFLDWYRIISGLRRLSGSILNLALSLNKTSIDKLYSCSTLHYIFQ